jgi:ATP-dependent DNA helicase DinG
MMEAQVHAQLRAYLRSKGLSTQPGECWPHHLTLGRLVARALRLGRSALIQVGTSGYCPEVEAQGYRLSYLMAVLLWPGSAVVVAQEQTLDQLCYQVIPDLQQWLQTHKSVCRAVDLGLTPQEFHGILLLTPDRWLQSRLEDSAHDRAAVTRSAPTLIEAVDDLEDWILAEQTLTVLPSHWAQLKLYYPQQSQTIQDTQIYLTHCFFQHPPNPYNAYLLSTLELERLQTLLRDLEYQGWQTPLPQPWVTLLSVPTLEQERGNVAYWTHLDRQSGTFTLHRTDLNWAPLLQRLWHSPPVILLRETIDAKLPTEAGTTLEFSERLGLEAMTQVQFSPHPPGECLHLYLPERLPLPNTPHYQDAALMEIRRVLVFGASRPGLTVILIQDTPLKHQVSSALVNEFGSRVQVDRLPSWAQPSTESDRFQGILVSSWNFWLAHRHQIVPPALMIMTTLPFPSVEHPLVAARVNYYKQHRQDWFQNFLLPQALRDFQRSIAPVRAYPQQGILTILDTRLIYRSYGQQFLGVLSPFTRLSNLDPFAHLAV